MLVDDDEDDQMIFTSAINEINNGIKCSCFSNAVDSWKMLQMNNKPRPDCIFLDLNMPFMHGFEFLQLIKTSKELNSIPVIIYSTSSRESDKIKASELGAFNFLSKPNSFAELKNKIRDLLNSLCNKH